MLGRLANVPKEISSALVTYTLAGLRVFPVYEIKDDRCACGKDCGPKDAGKHPRIANWQTEATNDLRKAFKWWERWPNANIGVVTGETVNAFVIDIDNANAWDSLGHEDIETFRYVTPRGGRHLWFTYPSGQVITNSSGSLPNGIDVRGTGGYVLMPPSRTLKGSYRDVQEVPRAEAPVWLLEALRTPEISRGELVEEKGLKSFGDLDAETQARYKRYVQGVIDSEVEALHELAEYEDLQWNNTTYGAACNLFELAKAPWSPLMRDEVEDLIRDNVPPFDNEGWNQLGLDKLLDSAYKKIFHNSGVRPYPKGENRPTTSQSGNNRSKKEKDKTNTPEEDLKPFVLKPASSIRLRRVEWLWNDRIALGEMSLLAGREGLGKSAISVWLAAQVSKGLLPGAYLGKPRNVLYLATEDSWDKTIAPRLVAAGADMDKVFYEQLEDYGSIYLPRDTARMALTIEAYNIGFMAMDPIMSYMGVSSNTYNGREVRASLEPIIKVCHEKDCAMLGLIHFNKSGTDDILNKITDSKAFTQLTRTVTVVMPRENEDGEVQKGIGIIDTVKNNLGSMNIPALNYEIVSHEVMTEDGPTSAGLLRILGEASERSEDLIREQTADLYRGQTKDAAEWLMEYIQENDGCVWQKDAVNAGARHDFKTHTLRRAMKRLKLKSQRMGGSNLGNAWFVESMDRKQASEVLQGRANAEIKKELQKLNTELDF